MECKKILDHNASKQVKEKMVPEERKNGCTLRSQTRGDLKIMMKPNNSCQGFSHFAVRLWNMLPEDVRNKSKPAKFKPALKQWIITTIPN